MKAWGRGLSPAKLAPPMTPQDVHTVLDAFLGVMAAEVVVKPVAARLGRWLLVKLDDLAGELIDLPDWLKTGR